MDMEAKTIGHPLKQIIHLSHSKTYQLSKDKHQGSFNYFSPTSVSWLLMQVYCPKQSLASRILRVLWTYFKYRPLTCTHTKKSPLFSDPRSFSLSIGRALSLDLAPLDFHLLQSIRHCPRVQIKCKWKRS